ncbi:MAG: rod shape-determining protein MreC [Candidatus Jorgensenbacteria bacterium]|nr:rod shape-determining protein MreC [Candidatus Jorgensenbacteria bacterium]
MKGIYTFIVSGVALIIIAVLIFARGNILHWLSVSSAPLSPAMLAAELLALKAQRADAIRTRHYIEARLYSRYPFNDQGVIVVAAGSDDGVRLDMPVLAREGVLFGRISAVRRTQSEVETIFDPAWRSSVYIGEKNTKAVLRGGKTPVIEFVPKEAAIQKGEIITNSSPNFPLGASAGTILLVHAVDRDLWQSADIDPGYTLNDVQSALIVTDFP